MKLVTRYEISDVLAAYQGAYSKITTSFINIHAFILAAIG